MSLAVQIAVRNAQRKVRIDVRELQNFATRALSLCLTRNPPFKTNLRKLAAVSVVLVSDRRMAALHRQFMNIAGPTDVITFQHGEIFASVETARRNATEFGTSLAKEIKLYIVHGLLHLDGFDDATIAASRAMETAQKRIFFAAFGTPK